jgi:Fe-S-cluster containining protein
VTACQNVPGWFLPREAKLAIEAGHAQSMMLDKWYEDSHERWVWVLAPASINNGGRTAPARFWFLHEGEICVFLKNERCAIHDSGFKPVECRKYSCTTNSGIERRVIKRFWNTEFGKAVVNQWREALLEARRVRG